MRVLLDTHALVWAAEDPGRLGLRARALIEDAGNTLLVSTISAWEVFTKSERGRLGLALAPDKWFEAATRTLGVEVLPLTYQAVLQGHRLRGFDRKDPADRFIVATALAEGVPLVTIDEWIVRWEGVATIW